MQTVKMLKNYTTYNKGNVEYFYEAGEIYQVQNNLAHFLIENGFSALYTTKNITERTTKDLKAGESKLYKTK